MERTPQELRRALEPALLRAPAANGGGCAGPDVVVMRVDRAKGRELLCALERLIDDVDLSSALRAQGAKDVPEVLAEVEALRELLFNALYTAGG